MNYQRSTWFQQALEYAAMEYVPPAAGKIADTLSCDVISHFQHKPYTWMKIRHFSNNVTYIACGFTFCDGVDVFNPEWGRDKAILRAKRKIAKRLVYEREAPKLLKRVQAVLATARAENFALIGEIHQMELEHIKGATVELP